MTINGHSLIAGQSVPGTEGSTQAVDPATGKSLDPGFSFISADQLDAAAAAAAEAFDSYRATTPKERAEFLERIADNIEARAEQITERGVAETGLPAARLEGERGRTTGQLRLFAQTVRAGDHQEVRVDPAQPDRQPAPRPDIRQRQIPVGPVAVFGASNFPLAFSTAGGDTASALAAGCPVIVKAHNAHPGTAELVGQAITEAVQASGLPAGTFSLIYGSGKTVGQALVSDPRIKAVGFTGSQAGGTALMKTAAARPEPIPVYAEMSSINPVFLLSGALASDAEKLGADFVGSLTMGSGQFCTNPGLVFVPNGADGDRFVSAAVSTVGVTAGQTMLTPGIAAACAAGIDRLGGINGVSLIAEGTPGDTENAPSPTLFETELDVFANEIELQEEVFGSASLIVRYDSVDELVTAVSAIQGQLTATLHVTDQDAAIAERLLPVLERRVGRILFNGWPTGVEVNHAMVHGGPFPATSDPRTTSVGTLAIYRFQRPVAYQNMPASLMPPAVSDQNPWGLRRRVDGEPRQD
ncbi:aldehyde dehydrogenase (NADP(+)) [Saxibacter everestensis]|uniref:Aldehyde dehydrogenase (NADP(+)) n=1 Tax=Saxibacter everestensis TaxID=2909229 RepID=A0ABY8QTT2_9MICO|nr:aldehyde dehydrogenase (NADP(+)) [Brevibacteriaceae bacterium ZFBP1038]